MTSETTAAELVESPDEDLARFGYTPQLRRKIGGFTSFALAFSMISVTTTVFTLFAQPFQSLGGFSIWLWVPVLGGVLLITMLYAHLAARLPVTGYAYQWSSRIVSRDYGWFVGFNAMLCTWVGSAGIAVALASVFASDVWTNPTHTDIVLLAGIATAFAVLFNIMSIKAAGMVNNAGALVELVGTLGFTAALGVGLIFFHHVQGPAVLVQVGSSTGSPANFGAIGLALLLPVYTLAGWEGSADLAEETTDPRAIAPKAMLRSVVVSGIAAFVIYAIFAMAIPGSIGATVNANSNPLVAIYQDHFGSVPADVLQVIAFVAMFSALLANITVATRTTFSLARDNMLPFSRVWGRINRHTATPIVTIVAVGVFAILVNLLSGGVVTNVLSVVNIALYITYGSTAVAVLIAHRRGTIPTAPAHHFDLGGKLIPVTVAALVFCLIVLVFFIGPASNHVILRYAIGIEVAGAVWYLAVVRRRLRNGQAGPRVTEQ